MRKISFEIKDNIFNTMKKYSIFSGVSIPSMIKNAIIDYLINKELVKIGSDTETYIKYMEIKEVDDSD